MLYDTDLTQDQKCAMLKRLELFNPGGVDKTFKHFWAANGSAKTRDRRATACGLLAAMCR